ncbi:hypothetical protein [Rhodococcus aetherivorans]|uniref:hypothetical protein n=1 Tax=Rhodococcus aetherivorans TaxID=191292 RepID=UPI0013DEE32A|nr:hypothetical protein [Rhodococcus aetherivorans]NGP26165.1 hypothetical protein [Rhodococcus aetherivorans]
MGQAAEGAAGREAVRGGAELRRAGGLRTGDHGGHEEVPRVPGTVADVRRSRGVVEVPEGVALEQVAAFVAGAGEEASGDLGERRVVDTPVEGGRGQRCTQDRAVDVGREGQRVRRHRHGQ